MMPMPVHRPVPVNLPRKRTVACFKVRWLMMGALFGLLFCVYSFLKSPEQVLEKKLEDQVDQIEDVTVLDSNG